MARINGTWYTVHTARYMVHGTRYMVRGTWYIVHSTRYTVHGTWYIVHGTWYMVHGTRYMAHDNGKPQWYMDWAHGTWPHSIWHMAHGTCLQGGEGDMPETDAAWEWGRMGTERDWKDLLLAPIVKLFQTQHQPLHTALCSVVVSVTHSIVQSSTTHREHHA